MNSATEWDGFYFTPGVLRSISFWQARTWNDQTNTGGVILGKQLHSSIYYILGVAVFTYIRTNYQTTEIPSLTAARPPYINRFKPTIRSVNQRKSTFSIFFFDDDGDESRRGLKEVAEGVFFGGNYSSAVHIGEKYVLDFVVLLRQCIRYFK